MANLYALVAARRGQMVRSLRHVGGIALEIVIMIGVTAIGVSIAFALFGVLLP